MRQRWLGGAGVKTKEIRVTDLQFDTTNYRTGKQNDQRDAIRALIEEQKNKLVNLAKDIMENGLSSRQHQHR